MRVLGVCIFTLIMIYSGAGVIRAEEELAVATSIEQVDVTIRYHGEEIQLFGEVEPGADVIIQVISPLETTRLKKRGRIFGFLWVNVKQAQISNVPGAYQEIYSTTQGELSPRVKERLNIGGRYGFVRDMARVSPEDQDAHFFLEGYIRAKEKQRLYSQREAGVDIIKDRLFRAAFELPSRAPVGAYRLEISTVKGNRVVGRGTAVLKVEQIGLQHWITLMAKEHAVGYGLMAVTIAIVAGFGVGLIFRARFQ